jgi:DNA-binding NarL/FixJ family response regulator
MLLLATQNLQTAHRWQSALAQDFNFYQPYAQEKKTVIRCLTKTTVDILILDKALLAEEGINDISVLLAVQPKTKIIIVTDDYKDREEISAILFGAKGYVKATLPSDLISKLVKKISLGELWVDRMFITRLLKEIGDITAIKHDTAVQIDKNMALLTPREREIAQLLTQGGSNRRIADHLHISERTVKAHLGVIFKKMGIKDRLHLALYMARQDTLSPIWSVKGDE